jgi:3-dehydroquinate synthase
MAKIKVELKERSYEIVVGADILRDLGRVIKQENWGSEIFIITDPLVNDLYGHKLVNGLKGFKVHSFLVPRGEKNKNLKSLTALYDQLVKCSAHRDSLIIALGGGVIGDLAGFVAATYMRGLKYIQVPTTLLAQVDAAIGGKTGINHPRGKNLIGSFYQPKLVYIDISTLSSLPDRELRTGLAEVVKYGVIRDDDFFKFLEANSHHLNTKAFEEPDTLRAALKVWQIIVTESAKIKAEVVTKDEVEADLRMILNYGHTIGHAIETLTHYQTYNHGEAVAIGMVAAAKIAKRRKMLDQESVQRIVDLIEKLGLPITVDGLLAKKMVQSIGIDKKVRGGKINYVLPEKVGKVVVRDNISNQDVMAVLREMGAK